MAYDCLSNPEKRDFYDRNGNEEPEQHFQHYQQRYREDISPQDIFRFFFEHDGDDFQSVFFGGNGRVRRQRREQENRNPEDVRRNNRAALLQFLPLFILIFSSFFMSFFQSV